MRRMIVIGFPLVALLAACSSTTSAPERAADAPKEEKAAAIDTNKCLDNPDLARAWGDCNVKSTLYMNSANFAQCRAMDSHAKGAVSFQLRVLADGHVKNAKALPGQANKKLVACLTKAMKKLQFAAPPKGKEATITVPYQLEN